MGDILRFNRNDDENDFEPSASEDDYSETEKVLLEKVRAGRKYHEESDEEVFGIHSEGDSDAENDGNDIEDMASDLDGQEEGDGLPDPKAWGKKRKTFHHTDYVDEDYGGFQGKDAEEAELEEQEARAIQERLAQQLDEQDFSLDIFAKPPASKEIEASEEVIKTDLKKLSKRQKLALLEKESPEFLSLVEDFKGRMTEVRDKLEPMMAFMKEGKIPHCSACDYIRTKYHLILNYSINIAFYLLLKARRISIQSHPVVRRLFQYRQLLKQLEPLDEVMTPQIDTILDIIKAGKPLVIAPAEKLNEDKRPAKKRKREQKEVPTSLPHEFNPEPVKDHSVESEVVGTEETTQEGVSKRAITYQIAKNKGITPRRKKEQRNPRVKHRNKYHRAVVRRKGQVREPRKEIQKYGGEISGIKIGVSKSIKLK
ncbi:something about silencing protein 10 [Anabrus simplex]|uniref:something about silencing protein 10 n=1 Tax=Anabrus simplex TaxID=316456 RepID=UPI0035A314ED